KTGAVPIVVQHPERELKISTRTFRSSLQPGQEENWERLVKGTGDEKVAAEVVAGMYDAALDKFGVNDFRLNLGPPIQQNGMRGWYLFNAIRMANSSSLTVRRQIPVSDYDKPENLERFGLTFTSNPRGA